MDSHIFSCTAIVEISRLNSPAEDILDIGMGIGCVETDSFRSRRESDLPMLSTILLRECGNSLGERGVIRGPSEVLERVMTSRVFRTLHDRDLNSGFGGTHDT
jgi:hypothetical protein